MCTHKQHHVILFRSSLISCPLLSDHVRRHLLHPVSQALKGIERALASSQWLEEEERAARELHRECVEASGIYEQLLDTAAKVYDDSIVDGSAPQHR
jgi:hypothetical protein